MKVFGSERRSDMLILLALLGESYPAELARLMESHLSAVQMLAHRLEMDGLVAARTVGRQRMLSLNPSFFAIRELRALLNRLASGAPHLYERVAKLRRRPRRASI